jgi:hypothetical protein
MTTTIIALQRIPDPDGVGAPPDAVEALAH